MAEWWLGSCESMVWHPCREALVGLIGTSNERTGPVNMTHDREDRESEGSARATTNVLIALNAGAFVLGVLLQHALGNPADGRTRVLSVVVGLLGFSGVLAASMRRSLLRTVASTRFGVVSLVTLTLFCILGTVVVQGQPASVLVSVYGGLAPVIRFLYLDDVFHSFGFSAIVGIASGSLVATVFTVKKLTMRRIGLIGAHMGSVIILAGAAVGSIWGLKGRLKMRVGEQAASFAIRKADGSTGSVPLGFTVRLDEFDLLHYEPDYRLRIFEIHGEDQKMVASFDPKAEDTAAKLREHGVTLEGYWPDHEARLEVKPAAAPEGGHALAAIGLGMAGSGGETMWFFDPGEGAVESAPIAGGGSLAFLWDTRRAEDLVASTASSAAKVIPHVIVVGTDRMQVEPGKTYALPGGGGSVKVLAAYKDFIIDPETHEASERSDRPDNPALRIDVIDASGTSKGERWLFANFPDFAHGEASAGPAMKYVYEGPKAGFTGGVLLVGEAGEAWTVEAGKVAARVPMAAGKPLALPGLDVKVAAIHRSASATYSHSTLSDKALDPVAQVKLEDSAESQFIMAGKAVELYGDRVLALTAKGDDVKDFLSQVTVLEEGREVLTRTVEVNHPLTHGGFSLYQSEYDPDDPTFSGFEVVSDPGLPLVYAGFVIMILAVAWVIIGVPIARRLRPAADAAGSNGGAR